MKRIGQYRGVLLISEDHGYFTLFIFNKGFDCGKDDVDHVLISWYKVFVIP